MDEGPMAAALSSEDILHLILSRVSDDLNLLCCAATCTRWFRIITSPPFRLWPAGNRPPSTFLLGMFSQQSSRVAAAAAASDNGRYFPPCFSRLTTGGTETPPTPSFFPDDDDDEGHGLSFNYAMPLASRSGLLLLRVHDGKDDDTNKLRLAVCNPVIGRRSARPIPPPPFFSGDPDLDVTGYALLTPSTWDLHHRQQLMQPAFQVLLTVLEYDGGRNMLLYAYSYSSWTGAWSRSAPMQVDRDLAWPGPRAGVLIVSPATPMVHWLYRKREQFYTLDVSPDDDKISGQLTAIPLRVLVFRQEISAPRPILCHGGDPGSLWLLITSNYHSHLVLWSKKQEVSQKKKARSRRTTVMIGRGGDPTTRGGRRNLWRLWRADAPCSWRTAIA